MTRCLPIFLLAVSLLAVAGCTTGGYVPPDEDAGPAALPCEYPSYSGDLRLGETMPPYRWTGARTADGEVVDLDLAEFFCSDEYDAYSSITLVIGAGWCSACPSYIREVDMMSGAIEAGGGLIVYLEVETADFEPATSAAAAEFIDGLIGAGPGLRVGDADNDPANAVRPLVSRMPSGYFIRRSDMRIVADQEESLYVVDFGALAGDPEGEWTPTPPPFEANCGPADEEALEPNDSFETAGAMPVDTVVSGGVCARAGDFYAIDMAGPWRFDLYSSIFEGDLNLRLYDRNGERIGGSTQRSNHDWVDYEGPAVVEVYGHDRASAVYTVELHAR